MADLQDLLRAFREFTEFLKNDADIILLQNIENLRSVILDRIVKGKDVKGSLFSKYSDVKTNPTLFKGINKPAGARSFIDKSIKSKTAISYKDIRSSVGLRTSSKNFSLTNDMLNSIDKKLESESNGEYVISLSPKDVENENKLIANEAREEAEILGFSQKEIDNMVLDIEDQLVKVLEKLIG